MTTVQARYWSSGMREGPDWLLGKGPTKTTITKEERMFDMIFKCPSSLREKQRANMHDET